MQSCAKPISGKPGRVGEEVFSIYQVMSCDAMSCDDDHDHEKEKVEIEEKTNNSDTDDVDDHQTSGLPFSDLTLQMDFGRFWQQTALTGQAGKKVTSRS